MRSSSAAGTVLFLAGLMIGTAVPAQSDPAQQAARAQALLRQVSAQKQELEVANADLTARVRRLESELAKATSNMEATAGNLAREQRRAQSAGASLDSTREQLAGAEGRLAETRERLRQTEQQLRETEGKLADTSAALAASESAREDSERKNLVLYGASVEILEAYRDKGPLAALLQREPSGLKRAGVETVVEEYRRKLDDARTDGNRIADGEPASRQERTAP
jgi:chromosome segregation ATPase